MSLRPSRRTHHQEETIHLNITPFLDIMVSLILFLLSATAFLKLAVIDTNLPKLVEATTVQPPEDKLVVTLKITNAGFEIGRVGEDVRTELQRHWTTGGDLTATIPRQKDGKYNFALLNQQMIRIKTVYPDALSVMLLPAGDVDYETLVHSMDATREVNDLEGAGEKTAYKKRALLFPDAVIGHVAEQEEGGA